jgi:hypothetical protein
LDQDLTAVAGGSDSPGAARFAIVAKSLASTYILMERFMKNVLKVIRGRFVLALCRGLTSIPK